MDRWIDKMNALLHEPSTQDPSMQSFGCNMGGLDSRMQQKRRKNCIHDAKFGAKD
jgi:hypothetical protein